LARLLRDGEAGRMNVVWFNSQERVACDVGFTADLLAPSSRRSPHAGDGLGRKDPESPDDGRLAFRPPFART
jgi:hypothetical protein